MPNSRKMDNIYIHLENRKIRTKLKNKIYFVLRYFSFGMDYLLNRIPALSLQYVAYVTNIKNVTVIFFYWHIA